jgi:ATP-binding cassette subfamily B protein
VSQRAVGAADDIPERLRPRLAAVLAQEPQHAPVLGASTEERRRFSLRSLFRGHGGKVTFAVLLVIAETGLLQSGPLIVQRALDRGVVARDTGVLTLMAILLVATTLVAQLAMSWRIRWTGRFGQVLMFALRIRVFRHLQRLSLDFYTRERSGRLLTRMTSDLEALTELLTDGVINLLVQGLTLIFVTAVLFSFNAQLALIVLALVVPTSLFMTLWFRSTSERRYTALRDRIADVMTDLQENLSGVRVVRAANRRLLNSVRHRETVSAHADASVDAARVGAVYAPGMDLLGTLTQVLILMVGGPMLLRGELTIGELTAFLLYVGAFFAPIQQLVQLYNQFQAGQAAVTKIADLLATEPSVRDAATATDLPPLRGEVRFDHVTFGYDPSDPVLIDIDLVVAPGETVALVGPTGAGKSTVAKLIPRLYDATEGRILVDGIDVRDVWLASLRRQIGVVPQEPYLFSGTLRDNIVLGRPDASDAEVTGLCERLGLGPLLSRLPEGIHAPVAERGGTLSAGERQLIALARALLVEPRVLVLDEATSSLDLQSEATVDEALDAAFTGRTGIVIAHRLSTAARADRVVVIVDGRIAEQGPHADLVASGGLYAAMHATWSEHATH